MKLYLVHCGYYDPSLCDGVYENHINLMIAAESFEDAKVRVKSRPEFKLKRMHVDGLHEVQAVDGWKVSMEQDAALDGQTRLVPMNYRGLAPKPAPITLQEADSATPAPRY